MTSASLKDISSLMTFVGTQAMSQAKESASSMSFGDAMAKASENSQQPVENTSYERKTEPEKNDFAKATDQSKPEKEVVVKDDNKVEATKKVESENEKVISDDTLSALNEKANEIVSFIASKFNVSEDDVVEAMEILQIDLLSVLDTSNLNNLVLELSVEDEPIALLTNESLFNAVQDLTAKVDATLVDLAEDMDIEVSDVVELIEQAEVQLSNNSEVQMSVNANLDTDTVKEPEIELKVTVKSNEESVELKTDESGNVIKAEVTEKPVTNAKKPDTDSEEHESHDDRKHESLLAGSNNSLINDLANDTHEVADIEEPQNPFFSQETREIMDQIMDNMKINLKPEMDELEMQLHPASLGTVKINLTNKAGEITAEFKVQNETVKAAVEAQLNELKQTLKDGGVKVQAVEVSVETSGFDSNLWQGEEKNNNFGSESRRRPRRININDLNALFEDEASEEEKLAASMMAANGNTVDYQA